MKKMNTRHVVPAPDGGWNSKKGGAKKASKHFDTKAEAEQYSREMSKKENSELYIHRKDGVITQKDSHGNDDYPPKG